ncbi:hypothetical protein RJ639_003609 [Escallonia herrerae]|uniref:Transposase (putative) gypsy type domain-containing protein n=1 Tax=Escallonia herrerae TaxID=1293975 RepID=A0AA88W0R1_9ASTE|nr:hypothetical protein RJ639_003609 [Escallonia herrerae]
MSNQDSENVFEPSDRRVRVEPTYDPSFLEIGMPVIPFQESKGVPAKEFLTEKAQSLKPFDAHTLGSKLSSYNLKLLRERCEIPPSIKLRLPDEGESANIPTIDEISVYWEMFINGFKVSLHPFFIKVLNAYGLAPGQFLPHAWHFISFFIYQCYKLGLRPRIRVFRTCKALKERDLSETDLEHIEKLKVAEPLESRYPLSNAQLRECGIIFSPEPQDFDEEEEEGENGPVDKSKEAPTKWKVPSRSGSRATSSSVRPNTPHRPAWGVSMDESVFMYPRTTWDWSSHAIIPMDHKNLSGYGITETANRMVQLMAAASSRVPSGSQSIGASRSGVVTRPQPLATEAGASEAMGSPRDVAE